MSVLSDVREATADLRRTVATLHAELVRYGLVVWTAGNVSGRVPDADLFVIKPSGVSYDECVCTTPPICAMLRYT